MSSNLLPESTRMLEQAERLHREANPIGNQLAAKLRGVVASELECQSLWEQALTDLNQASCAASVRDAGDSSTRITGPILEGETKQAVLTFAAKLTLAGYKITDEEVAALVRKIGIANLVGIVHTVAFANFQARLNLALSSEATTQSLTFDFSINDATNSSGPPDQCELQSPKPSADKRVERIKAPGEWAALSYDQIKMGMLSQEQSTCRVPIPSDHQLAHLTEDQRRRSERVVWSRVSLGYQPELTLAWFRLMDAFDSESETDPVLCNSLFLVVTRSNQCFY